MTESKALVKLEDYDTEKFNVLHPATVVREGDVISPVIVQSVSVVPVDPRPAEGPDLYVAWWANRDDPRKLAPTAHLLHRIGVAAGLRWAQPNIQGPHRDPQTGHKSVVVTASAEARLPNGEWVGISKSREIDTADLEEKWLGEGYEKAARRAKKTVAELPAGEVAAIKESVRKRILQMKEKIVAEAETKAMNRVLRSLLGIGQAYSAQEIRKPFVVPRLLYRPDVAMAIEEGRRAEADLGWESGGYTPPSPPQPAVGGRAPSDGGSDGSPQEATGNGEPKRTPAEPASATPEPGEIVEPKDDPLLTDAGPHKGKRMSEVAQMDPGYLEAMKVHGRTKALRDLAKAHLDYWQPQQQSLSG